MTYIGPGVEDEPGISPDEDPEDDPDVYAVVVALHPDGEITVAWPKGWERYKIIGLLAEGQHVVYETEEL